MLRLHNEQRLDIVARLRAAGCVFAEDEADLLISSARTQRNLGDMVHQRVAGLPLEQVVGWAAFCGLRVIVNPGVFVPRRRTEFLVHQAAALARPTSIVVDLCCGSGAVGLALMSLLGRINLHAVDIEPAAVRCARQNIGGHGTVYEGDLFDPLPSDLKGRVDLIVANVPYVPTDEIALMPQEARVYEPQMALDGGADGLAVQRRVAAEAPRWLAPGGSLLMETSARQAAETADLFTRHGLKTRVMESDESEATIVVGTLQTIE